MGGSEKSEEASGSKNRRGGTAYDRSPHSHHKRKRRDDSHSGHRSKRRRSRSDSREYEKREHRQGRGKRSHKSLNKEERDRKIDEIFNWVKSSGQKRRSRDRSHSRFDDRSRSSSYSRGSRTTRRSTVSRHREHDISFDSRSVRSVVVPVGTTTSGENQEKVENVDSFSARLKALREESIPKPLSGPPISEDLAPILNVFLAKSEFVKTMKVCEKYPRPANVDLLTIPELPKDAEKIIDQKAVKNDDRLKNDQKCSAALFCVLGKSLEKVMKLRESVPELIEVGDMLLDGLQMSGFIHQDFTSIRLKGFKQTVNPSYGDVVSQKPEEPDMLLGKTPLGEQMKSCEEINKLKAKFKKPDSANLPQKKDFRRGGEYKRKQFGRDFKQRNRRREDKSTRYFSPKGNYRKNQQETAQKQEERKNQNFRKN